MASDAQAGIPETPKIDCGFTLAIIAVVVGNVVGIVALIYAVLASNMLQNGDYEGARRAVRTGKVWSWTAIILFAATLCLGMLVLPRLWDLIAPGLTVIETELSPP
jgi:formate/nitrite transporter FocA (FNT family)